MGAVDKSCVLPMRVRVFVTDSPHTAARDDLPVSPAKRTMFPGCKSPICSIPVRFEVIGSLCYLDFGVLPKKLIIQAEMAEMLEPADAVIWLLVTA